MGLNAQPSGERVHIGFFGLRNAGKSSVVNRVTGPNIVHCFRCQGHNHRSGAEGDGMLPTVRWLSFDTPGIDDEGALGAERVRPGTARAGKDGYCGSCHGQHA